MIKKIKELIMAKLNTRRLVPIGEELQQGAVPMDKVEILEALARYKVQNPAKYEAKKAALFARYGLKDEEEIADEELDESDVELAELTKKAKKSK